MIPREEQLDPVARQHPAYSQNHELLCVLNPKHLISLRSIAKTIGGTEKSILKRINTLRSRGIRIEMRPIRRNAQLGQLGARIHPNSWPKALDTAERYWKQVYEGWHGIPAGIGNGNQVTDRDEYSIYDYATTRADQ